MRKIDFFMGIFIGLILTLMGSYLFLFLFTSTTFSEGFNHLKINGQLGKLITLGALLNIGMVFLLFKKNRDLMAKGVIFSLFVLVIYTLFV